MNFQSHFKLIQERKFKDSQHIAAKLISTPMFSFFLHKNVDNKDMIIITNSYLKLIADAAQKEINKIGFSTMHVNVMIKNIDDKPNSVTGKANDIAALAHGGRHTTHNGGYKTTRKYIVLNTKSLIDNINNDRTETDISNLIHEWAHIWFFNHKKEFKDTLRELYTNTKSNANLDMNEKDINDHPFQLEWHDNYVLINKKFKETLQTLTLNYNSINNPNTQHRQFLNKFQLTINDVFHLLDLSTNYNSELDQLSYNAADALTNIVLPQLQKYPPAQYPDMYKDINDITANLWARNPHRPENLMFRTLIAGIYVKLKSSKPKLHGEINNDIRTFLAKIIKWPTSYGMGDSDEFWATAIEHFFKLNYQNKKLIINTMMNS